MADYEYAYRLLQSPEARTDGSGGVDHDITKIYRVVDSGTPWNEAPPVPGRHSTFVVPSADLKTVMDMPDGNATQKQAKNGAYKDLLRDNAHTVLDPITGWEDEECDEFLNNNPLAVTEAVRANNYITVTLGQEYPVEFVL